MQNQQYLELLENLGNRYKNTSTAKNDQNKNKIVIHEEDLKRLSRFELNTLRNVGNMFGILEKNGEEVNYQEMIDIVNRLTRHKTDPEKIYLLGLFFPDKLKNKNIHHVNPFP